MIQASIAIAAALLSIAAVIAVWRWSIERAEDRWMRRTTKAIGAEIMTRAHWFSESKEAYALVVAIGEHMARTGGYNPDSVREEWRRVVNGE